MLLVIAIVFVVYSLAITGLYFRADDQRHTARTERDEARQERDQAWSDLVAAEAERQAAARFAAHWQAVAAGHPSADTTTFGRHAARPVLTDDLDKNRSGQ